MSLKGEEGSANIALTANDNIDTEGVNPPIGVMSLLDLPADDSLHRLSAIVPIGAMGPTAETPNLDQAITPPPIGDPAPKGDVPNGGEHGPTNLPSLTDVAGGVVEGGIPPPALEDDRSRSSRGSRKAERKERALIDRELALIRRRRELLANEDSDDSLDSHHSGRYPAVKRPPAPIGEFVSAPKGGSAPSYSLDLLSQPPQILL